MQNGRKFLIAVSALVLGVLAFSGLAAAAPDEAGARVTIQGWSGGKLGYVDTQPARCEKNRAVFLFRQFGARRRPGSDRPIGRSITRDWNGHGQWSVKSKASGRFYAKAAKKFGCRSDVSRTITAAPRAAGPAACPSTSNSCTFSKLHLDGQFVCPSFSKDLGICGGPSTGAPLQWSPGLGSFYWQEFPNMGGKRRVLYRTQRSVFDKDTLAYLDGTMPGPGSADFSVKSGGTIQDPSQIWYTPDLPGKPAGSEGGPLYVNFVNGTFAADVYIWGYLFRKPTAWRKPTS